MKKLYAIIIVLLGTSGLSQAQTPAQNLMPDGSHDLYMGLGVIVRPNYEGSKQHKIRALPVFQMQWSNGAFISGMHAGLHLSDQPQRDFGPLIGIEPGRNSSGSRNIPDDAHSFFPSDTTAGDASESAKLGSKPAFNTVKARLTAGGFYHMQLNPQLRWHNQLLYGSGNDRNGLRFNSDLRFRLPEFSSHQAVTIGLGLQAVNQAYARSYFGVNDVNVSVHSLSLFDGIAFAKTVAPAGERIEYKPRAGVKDLHLDLFWNVNLSSSWLVTTKLNASYLLKNAANSPLVQQRTNVTVSTALAYRF